MQGINENHTRPYSSRLLIGYRTGGTNNKRLPDRWRHRAFGGGRVRKLSDVCLHNNAIVARGILVTNVALWDTRTASAPSISLVLLEPHSKIGNC